MLIVLFIVRSYPVPFQLHFQSFLVRHFLRYRGTPYNLTSAVKIRFLGCATLFALLEKFFVIFRVHNSYYLEIVIVPIGISIAA